MRLLIIEDEEDITDFLTDFFESEYFVVDIAHDGQIGSMLARTNSYDVIIVDFTLPKKNGKKICEEIRESGKTTPILMLSVLQGADFKAEIINCGADDYLTKPFSLRELKARIYSLLRRPPLIQNEMLVAGDLEIDLRQHTVTKKGIRITLRKKEYMLLEFLMKNQGIALSRSMIMEHVWDMNADPFSNTIETHILNLRKKIDPEGLHIHTLSGMGYKFEA